MAKSAVIASGSAMVLSSVLAYASVSGPCANCHTMHNSQSASAVVMSGNGTGWNANGELSGGTPSDSAQGSLLVSNCVGCHSSNTGDTIIELGSSKIPIVYNTSGYPTKPLAAGNFYQVAQGSEYDGYGHNVYGISGIDSNLDKAPGSGGRCSGFNSACHNTLAVAPDMGNYNRGGCQGCHYNVYHHEDNNHYRFLNNHDGDSSHVEGIEHDHWEHDDYISGTSDHNYYKGIDQPNKGAATLSGTNSISTYCGGCHNNFHDSDETGTGSPWVRHPTDIALPTDREYAAYDPTTDYSRQAPVAWVDPANPVRSEAVVMCLSCHRVHGSQNPDILRWDYSTMIAGDNETGAAIGEGCFVCHTTKD